MSIELFEKLSKVLKYEPDTGRFFYKKTGKETGHKTTRGYIAINANNTQYLAHKLAFFFVYRRFAKQIDHINRIRHDNRIENLREALPIVNALNRTRRSKSGVKGVEIIKSKNKTIYRARTNKGQIGCFDTLAEAKAAYVNHYKKLGISVEEYI